MIAETIAICFTLLVAIIMVMMLFRKFLPKNIVCDFFGWHGTVIEMHHDGCSQHGICTKCNKDVMQDSQGNWF